MKTNRDQFPQRKHHHHQQQHPHAYSPYKQPNKVQDSKSSSYQSEVKISKRLTNSFSLLHFQTAAATIQKANDPSQHLPTIVSVLPTINKPIDAGYRIPKVKKLGENPQPENTTIMTPISIGPLESKRFSFSGDSSQPLQALSLMSPVSSDIRAPSCLPTPPISAGLEVNPWLKGDSSLNDLLNDLRHLPADYVPKKMDSFTPKKKAVVPPEESPVKKTLDQVIENTKKRKEATEKKKKKLIMCDIRLNPSTSRKISKETILSPYKPPPPAPIIQYKDKVEAKKLQEAAEMLKNNPIIPEPLKESLSPRKTSSSNKKQKNQPESSSKAVESRSSTEDLILKSPPPERKSPERKIIKESSKIIERACSIEASTSRDSSSASAMKSPEALLKKEQVKSLKEMLDEEKTPPVAQPLSTPNPRKNGLFIPSSSVIRVSKSDIFNKIRNKKLLERLKPPTIQVLSPDEEANAKKKVHEIFFAFFNMLHEKHIDPKLYKNYCRRCMVHYARKAHYHLEQCPYKICNCNLCTYLEGKDYNFFYSHWQRHRKDLSTDAHCVKCRNHNIHTVLRKYKRHKKLCPFRSCICGLCLKTERINNKTREIKTKKDQIASQIKMYGMPPIPERENDQMSKLKETMWKRFQMVGTVVSP